MRAPSSGPNHPQRLYIQTRRHCRLGFQHMTRDTDIHTTADLFWMKWTINREMTNFAQNITLPSPCPEKMLEALLLGGFFQAVCGCETQKDLGQPWAASLKLTGRKLPHYLPHRLCRKAQTTGRTWKHCEISCFQMTSLCPLPVWSSGITHLTAETRYSIQLPSVECNVLISALIHAVWFYTEEQYFPCINTIISKPD